MKKTIMSILIISFALPSLAEERIVEAEIIKYGSTDKKGRVLIEAFSCDGCNSITVKLNLNKSIIINNKKISASSFLDKGYDKGMLIYNSSNNEVLQFQPW